MSQVQQMAINNLREILNLIDSGVREVENVEVIFYLGEPSQLRIVLSPEKRKK